MLSVARPLSNITSGSYRPFQAMRTIKFDLHCSTPQMHLLLNVLLFVTNWLLLWLEKDNFDTILRRKLGNICNLKMNIEKLRPYVKFPQYPLCIRLRSPSIVLQI
jgi:hypothetical protein